MKIMKLGFASACLFFASSCMMAVDENTFISIQDNYNRLQNDWHKSYAYTYKKECFGCVNGERTGLNNTYVPIRVTVRNSRVYGVVDLNTGKTALCAI